MKLETMIKHYIKVDSQIIDLEAEIAEIEFDVSYGSDEWYKLKAMQAKMEVLEKQLEKAGDKLNYSCDDESKWYEAAEKAMESLKLTYYPMECIDWNNWN